VAYVSHLCRTPALARRTILNRIAARFGWVACPTERAARSSGAKLEGGLWAGLETAVRQAHFSVSDWSFPPSAGSSARSSRRYCWLPGLVAGLAAAGFGFGAQKSGSALTYSCGGLLIFGLTENSVLSVLIMMSENSLLYLARLSAPKASGMLIAPGVGSIALSESMPLKIRYDSVASGT